MSRYPRGRCTTVYRFDASGKLSSITDAAGFALTMTYNGAGQLITVTSVASGRKLNFAWTSASVSSISTDAVAAHGGALTWRYTYLNGSLTKSCDPLNNCQSYEITGNRVSKVTRPLGNAEVALTYDEQGRVLTRTNGVGDKTSFAYPYAGIVRVTDPRGGIATTQYDDHYRVTAQRDAQSKFTNYTYSAEGYRTSITDALGQTAKMTYDARGNMTSYVDPIGYTSYWQYSASDDLMVFRDARSEGPDDNRYATFYQYDAAGRKISETTPSTDQLPQGATHRWTYTQGTEAAYGGGLVRAGLLASEIDGKGSATTYSYDAKGDQRQVVDRAGMRVVTDYDEIGRQIKATQFSDTFAGGVTRTTSYDALSRSIAVTDPASTSPITGKTHQLRTINAYDANGRLTETRLEDATGGDASRTTRYYYDNADRVVSTADPAWGWQTRHFDASGNVDSVTDALGRVFTAKYDERNQPVEQVAKAYTDGRSAPRDVVVARYVYDAVGRKVTQFDALSRQTNFTYDGNNRVTLVSLVNKDLRDQSTQFKTHNLYRYGYDAVGNVLYEAGPDQATTNYQYQAGVMKLRSDPSGASTWFDYDANDNVVAQTVIGNSQSEVTRYAYDNADRRLSQTVENGSESVVTGYGYDNRGAMTSMTDPRGFVTNFVNDELGRPSRTTSPLVKAETTTGTVDIRPTTSVGYSTFGELTESKDERGNVTTAQFDVLGRQISSSLPAYAIPGGGTIAPTQSWAYDAVGNQIASTDRRGQRTDYAFDSLNRVVLQRDPLSGGARGETRYSYDDGGNLLAKIDPSGARTDWTYNYMGNVLTETQTIRPGDQRLTTNFEYGSGDLLTKQTDPLGNSTQYEYGDFAFHLTRMTDALGKSTNITYDVHDRVVSIRDPLGRSTVNAYDLAGRPTSTQVKAADGTVLSTTSKQYDTAGNVIALVSPAGATTRTTYDALNRPTSVTQPFTASTSGITSFGYDAAGNLAKLTDARGNVTSYTANAWNQNETVVEPSTAAYASAADRTFTTTYDAAGFSVKQQQPGGVTLNRTFDELGRVKSETGSGAGVATANRTFGYDAASRITSVSHPNGSINFGYDDRGLLTSTTSPSGSSSFSYDSAGRMTTRRDVAGTTNYSWTKRNELASVKNALTNQNRSFTYDDAGQLLTEKFGDAANAATRTFGYDAMGRVTNDTIKTSSGATTASQNYTYDADSNISTKSVNLPGNPANGMHAYTYDQSDRLMSWKAPNGSTTTYEYDATGNRTKAGNAAFTYDSRNRVTAAPDGNYTWSARGTLSSVAGASGTTNYSYDGLDRLTNVGATNYAYDGLDRIATRNGTAFQYDGAELDATYDGTTKFARDPAGGIIAESIGTNNKEVALNNHGDVTALLSVDGALSDSMMYDPFGQVIGRTGTTTTSAGFQGDYADPATGKVWMGARWYAPNTGTFLARDTYSGEIANPISLNRYTYGNANPLAFFDADGHKGFSITGAISSVGNAVSSGASAVTNTVSNGAQAAWNGTKQVASGVAQVATTTVNTTRKAVSAAASATTTVIRASTHAVTALGSSAVRATTTTLSTVRTAARVTAESLQTTGAFIAAHKDAILTAALVVGAGVCIVASAGACAVATAAVFAANTTNNALKYNIVGGGSADWGGFLKGTAIDAALTWGPGAILKSGKLLTETTLATRVGNGVSKLATETKTSLSATGTKVNSFASEAKASFNTKLAINGPEAGVLHLPGVGKGVDDGILLFRTMKEMDGMPAIGNSARQLGVRDIDIPMSEESVTSGMGGISVSPNSPHNLPNVRRPVELGGSSKDPLWCISTRDLPLGLTYRPDPMNPAKHGFIEPSGPMKIQHYEDLVSKTQLLWRKVD